MLQLFSKAWPSLQTPSPSQELWRPRPLDQHLWNWVPHFLWVVAVQPLPWASWTSRNRNHPGTTTETTDVLSSWMCLLPACRGVLSKLPSSSFRISTNSNIFSTKLHQTIRVDVLSVRLRSCDGQIWVVKLLFLLCCSSLRLVVPWGHFRCWPTWHLRQMFILGLVCIVVPVWWRWGGVPASALAWNIVVTATLRQQGQLMLKHEADLTRRQTFTGCRFQNF